MTRYGNLEGVAVYLDTLASDQILFWKPSDMIKFDFETPKKAY